MRLQYLTLSRIFCAALVSGCSGTSGNLLTSLISDDASADAAIFGDAAPPPDASDPVDLHAPDSPLQPTSCTPWGDSPSFYLPRALSATNTSSDERSPFVTVDGRQLFFSSDRPGGPGGLDVYVAYRPNAQANFGSGSLYDGASTADDESGFFLSGDGLAAYLSSPRPGGMGQADIWTAARADPQIPFSPADFSPLAEVNNEGHQLDPFLSENGQRLYLTTDGILENGSLADLAVAEWSSAAGVFSEPMAIPGLDAEGVREGGPSLTSDQRLIVFSSDRPGGPGGSDLWYATRDSADAAFSEPRLLAALNTSDSEGEVFITPDGCEVFFGRHVDGQWDLFVARFRSP